MGKLKKGSQLTIKVPRWSYFWKMTKGWYFMQMKWYKSIYTNSYGLGFDPQGETFFLGGAETFSLPVLYSFFFFVYFVRFIIVAFILSFFRFLLHKQGKGGISPNNCLSTSSLEILVSSFYRKIKRK